MKYCIYCGTQLPEGGKICPKCGKKVRTKTKKGCGSVLLACLVLLVAGVGLMTWLDHSGLLEGSESGPKPSVGNETEVMAARGFDLAVEKGTFPEGSSVETIPASDGQVALLKQAGGISRLSSPMEIGSKDYDGSFFTSDVVLTLPMARKAGEKGKDLGRYVFAYYDETQKKVRYLWPNRYDLKNNTISVRMPHFSLWSSAELTEEEQIESFLDAYCTKIAVEKGQQEKAAAELAPYVEAKAQALGLTKEAAKDLVQSTINYLCGSISPEATGIEDIDVVTGTSSSITTNAIRAYYDNDPSRMNDELSNSVNTAMMWAWNGLEFSKKASKVFKSEYVQEFVPGSIGTTLTNLGGIGSMAGRMVEGDFKGGMEELGGILQGIHPAAGLTTKSVKFLAACANTGFTYWKDNEVEELYQVYKNGARGLFGNQVRPCDRESFLEFLNYGSGFTKGKAVYRFYQMDKAAEVCEKYGWSETDYAKLDQRRRDIFNQRAESGLLEYFELRRKQEAEAEKIKAVERRCVQDMLNPYYGVLYSDNYKRFFGESSDKDFNITNRLERLVKVRTFISRYVDEKELAKSSKVEGSFNYGTLINEWVSLASRYPKNEAVERFKDYLKSIDMLKKEPEEKPVNETYDLKDMKKIADFMSDFNYRIFEDSFKGCKFEYDERTKTGTITMIPKEADKYVIKILDANTIRLPNGQTVKRDKIDNNSNAQPFKVERGNPGTKKVK